MRLRALQTRFTERVWKGFNFPRQQPINWNSRPDSPGKAALVRDTKTFLTMILCSELFETLQIFVFCLSEFKNNFRFVYFVVRSAMSSRNSLSRLFVEVSFVSSSLWVTFRRPKISSHFQRDLKANGGNNNAGQREKCYRRRPCGWKGKKAFSLSWRLHTLHSQRIH